VNGLLKTLKQAKPIFIYGLILVAALIIIQLLLDALQNSFLLYMPPIGFAFFLFTQYGIQPIIVGALNVAILRRFYKCEDWQTGFWLNGLFLLLAFTTINVILQTITGLPFAPYIALIDILVLPYLFGHLGKFSNRGRKPANTQQPVTTSAPQEMPCPEPLNKHEKNAPLK
jgi:hypothetical protein